MKIKLNEAFKTHKFKNIFTVLSSLILVLVLLLAIFKLYDNYKISQVDCEKLLSQMNLGVKNKSYKAVYSRSSHELKACSKQNSVAAKEQDKLQSMRFEYALAEAAHKDGNKVLAKEYSARALTNLRQIDTFKLKDSIFSDSQKIVELNYEVNKRSDGTYDGLNE